MPVINVNLFSIYLKFNIDCTIILPDNIQNEKLKCLWLYHGGNGSHKEWLYHNEELLDISEKNNLAIVLPNVNESCFIDMNIGERYGAYVGKELPETICSMFRCISKERKYNYIAGLSNGGYGCLHTALTYPKRFCAVGAFSAGDKADSDYLGYGSEKIRQRINLFGEGDIHKTDYCIIHLANKLIEKNVNKPIIYHACGGKDPWLDKNHILRDYFLSHKQYKYIYEELPEYGHEWSFWKLELKKFIKLMNENN